MVDFQESSHLHLWLYGKPEYLSWCRQKANHAARSDLGGNAPKTEPPDPTEASYAARGWMQRYKEGKEQESEYQRFATEGPWENAKGKHFLNAQEEATLVSFYATKFTSVIGPKASITRLRRESKVTATAALLYRRFFLSNSVMFYDPKAIMVAAAFLASKVEDASADLRHLEEATHDMNAPVPQDEILAAELALIQGIAFDLLCFHPYKAVLALTQDLRVFLKSDKGKALVAGRPVSGQDLKPLFTQAKSTLEEAILHTDLALLYTPGQIGLASLLVAQEILNEKAAGENNNTPPLDIDWHGYIQHRFESSPAKESTWQALQELRVVLKQPTPPIDMAALKAIHKKLKKVRLWGENNSSKKRKKGESEEGTDTKRVKTE